MTQKLDTLQAALEAEFGDTIKVLKRERAEISLTVTAEHYLQVAHALRDRPALKFEQLIDLCGVDFSDYKNRPWDGVRYCVVSHLLSVSHNWRVRLKVFAPDDDMPVVASVNDIWAAANWFEREAFDLYGIIF
ncbi:MAG: NADH-quinone oxidoreductase subunit C, partial [Rubrivivax sp.]